MHLADFLILGIILLWAICAIRHIRRHRGTCSGMCENCPGSCAGR